MPRFNMSASDFEPTEVDSSDFEPTEIEPCSGASSITGDNSKPPSSPASNAGDPSSIQDPFGDGDVPWYEQQFCQRVEDELEGPVQGCELPEILSLYFDDDHKWQFEGGHMSLYPHQVEQLKPWLNLRRLEGAEIPIPGENRSRSSGELRIDESAPLVEMMSQLLENMQPGFRKTLLWAFVCFEIPCGVIP